MIAVETYDPTVPVMIIRQFPTVQRDDGLRLEEEIYCIPIVQWMKQGFVFFASL